MSGGSWSDNGQGWQPSDQTPYIGHTTDHLCSSVFICVHLWFAASARRMAHPDQSSTISGSLRTGKFTEFAMKQ